MHRFKYENWSRRLLGLALALMVVFGSGSAFGQSGEAGTNVATGQSVSQSLLAQEWPPYPAYDDNDPHAIGRGPGGYLSWWKLLCIALVFVVWIKSSDWMNKDACEMHDITNLSPGLFNPLNLMVFFFGFVLTITVPWFFVGFPIYVLAAFGPFMLYVMMRNGKVEAEDKAFMSGDWMRRAMRGKVYRVRDQAAIAETGPEIEFIANGATGEEKQSNLIRARQVEHFPVIKWLLHDSIQKRASAVFLDFTQDAVQIRMEVDGFWHQLQPMDRVTGDSMLVGLKSLAAVNPADRRSLQQGAFRAVIDLKETPCEFTSQGVATGEQVTIKIAQAYTDKLNLAQVGMWPESVEALTEAINGPGITVISAPPKGGLSTTWQSVINKSDRIMRDCISLCPADEKETNFENVARHQLIIGGKGNVAELNSLLLRNPDVYVLPEMADPEFMNAVIKHVADEDRCLITKVPANSAVESILRVMQKTTERKLLAEKISFATCQKLVRRLCDACKQPLQTNPNFLKQLGAKPGEDVNVCGPYQLPPPSQRVDETGKPIEMQECHVCNGLGYIGRIAVVETLKVDDEFRKELLKTPKLDVLTQVARKQGNLTMVQQGYRLVLGGVTSVQEIQRVFQQKKK